MAERRILRGVVVSPGSITEDRKAMTDHLDVLPMTSKASTVPAGQLRGSFLGHRHDEDVIIAVLEAEQKRDRVFMRAMSIVLGGIMAVLIVITAVASLEILNPMDAPVADGFETTVRSDLLPSGAAAGCRPFQKCSAVGRGGTDG